MPESVIAPSLGREVLDSYLASGIECGGVLARLGQVNYDWMARMKERMEERSVRSLNANIFGLRCDPVSVLGLSGVEEKLELCRCRASIRETGPCQGTPAVALYRTS